MDTLKNKIISMKYVIAGNDCNQNSLETQTIMLQTNDNESEACKERQAGLTEL